MLTLTLTSCHAQSITPKTLLHRTDSACNTLRSISFHARYSGIREGSDTIRREGKVTLAWNSGKTRAKSGIRIEGNDGAIGAFDGFNVHLLLPKEERMINGDTTTGALRAITGGALGSLIPGFLEEGASPFSSLITKARDLRLDSTVYVGETECYRLTYRIPDNEYFSDMHFALDIGTGDFVPRRTIYSVRFDGRRETDELLLTDLIINPLIAASDFQLTLPEGYELVRHTPPNPPKPLVVGSMAPDWSLSDKSGMIHSLKDYRGKILLLDFWYTTCGPCLRMMPALQRLHERYADRGVTVLGVNCYDPDRTDPTAFLKRRGITYPTLLHGDSVAARYAVTHFPMLYLIGVDGRILHVEVGESDSGEQTIREVVEGYVGKDK